MPQITTYLSDKEWNELNTLAQSQGTTLYRITKGELRRYLADHREEPAEASDQTASR